MGLHGKKLFIFLQSDGFPTILFFPAGNKSSNPVSTIFDSASINPTYTYSSIFLKV